ncbi:MAG: hypothetical protein WCC00_04885 [Candidatus Aminicenantales bacterium]
MDPRDELRTHLRPAALVGSAILVSLVIYLGLVEVLRAVLKPFRGFAAAAGIQPIRLAVFGAAAVVILVILLLRPRLFRRDKREDSAAAFRRLQSASLVILVLGEIPVVLGLALFLIGGNAVDFYKFLFASLVLTFINFPRRSAWEEWLKG